MPSIRPLEGRPFSCQARISSPQAMMVPVSSVGQLVGARGHAHESTTTKHTSHGGDFSERAVRVEHRLWRCVPVDALGARTDARSFARGHARPYT